MEKLIKLDPVTKRYCEVDRIKLERVTQELLDFIHKEIFLSNDPHEIWKWVVPLCEGVLDGTLRLPLPYDQLPLKYKVREGLLELDFEEKYAPFALTITGTPIEPTIATDINGETYTFVDFEE